MALGIGGLITSYVLWEWPGLVMAALVIAWIGVSSEIEARVQRKRDLETARKYGAYGEVEASNYPAPEAPTDKPRD